MPRARIVTRGSPVLPSEHWTSRLGTGWENGVIITLDEREFGAMDLTGKPVLLPRGA